MRDRFCCAAQVHHPDCDGIPHEAHHIVYRSHLTEATRWLTLNGVALSRSCQQMAHETHNRNIDPARCIAAVEAVNRRMDEAGDPVELRRPYFSHADPLVV